VTRDQVIRLLGKLPTDPWGNLYSHDAECSKCKTTFTEQSIAWDTFDAGGPDEGTTVLCISCALQAELDREAEDER